MFLACRLGSDAAGRLHDALQPLQRALARRRWRWVAPENYHVTLRFFGTQSAETAADVCRLVAPIAVAERAPMRCRVTALLALPSWSRPAVLALALDSGGALEQLAQACEAAIAPRLGTAERRFRAHLTVARCRRPRRLMPPVVPLTFELDVTSCGLYRSTLSQSGPRYDPVCEFGFAGTS